MEDEANERLKIQFSPTIPSHGGRYEAIFVEATDSSKTFYITLKDNVHIIEEIESCMSSLNLKPLEKGEIKADGSFSCAILEGSRFSRCQVVNADVDDNLIVVQFIDHGRVQIVNNLYPLPQGYEDIPPLALECRLLKEGEVRDSLLQESVMETIMISSRSRDSSKRFIEETFSTAFIRKEKSTWIVRIHAEIDVSKFAQLVINEVCKKKGSSKNDLTSSAIDETKPPEVQQKKVSEERKRVEEEENSPDFIKYKEKSTQKVSEWLLERTDANPLPVKDDPINNSAQNGDSFSSIKEETFIGNVSDDVVLACEIPFTTPFFNGKTNCFAICITAVEDSAETFFAFQHRNDVDVQKLAEDLEDAFKSANSYSNEHRPHKGMAVLARGCDSANNIHIFRGDILGDRKGNTIKVMNLDDGIVSTVCINNDLRTFPRGPLVYLPRLAFRCKFANIKVRNADRICDFINTNYLNKLLVGQLEKTSTFDVLSGEKVYEIDIRMSNSALDGPFLSDILVDYSFAQEEIEDQLSPEENNTKETKIESPCDQKAPSESMKDAAAVPMENEEMKIKSTYDPMEQDFHQATNKYMKANAGPIDNVFGDTDHHRNSICKFYGANGKCIRGNACNYLHIYNGNMDSVNPDLSSISFNEIEIDHPIGSVIVVQITQIRSPYQFYCIMPFGPISLKGPNAKPMEEILMEFTSADRDETLETLNRAMNSFFDANRHVNKVVSVNTSQVFAACIDSVWYRARLVDIPTKMENLQGIDADGYYFTVYLVDYGEVVRNVTFTQLRRLDDRFSRLPYQAFECELYDVQPAEGEAHQWEERAIKEFCQIAKDPVLVAEIMYKHPNGKLTLNIMSNENGSSVGQLLIQKGLAVHSKLSSVSNMKGFQPG